MNNIPLTTVHLDQTFSDLVRFAKGHYGTYYADNQALKLAVLLRHYFLMDADPKLDANGLVTSRLYREALISMSIATFKALGNKINNHEKLFEELLIKCAGQPIEKYMEEMLGIFSNVVVFQGEGELRHERVRLSELNLKLKAELEAIG